MYNCPQVSFSLNNDYSQAWRMDKYLVNFLLLIYWSTVMQITTFSEKIFHRAFLFFLFFSEDYLKCIQEIRKIKVTLHWWIVLNVENVEIKRSISLYVSFAIFRIYCHRLDKNNRKNRNLNEPLLVFQIWLVGVLVYLVTQFL